MSEDLNQIYCGRSMDMNLKDFESLDSFLKHWNEADKKQTILKELEEQGIQAQEILSALLDKYADDGIENLENMNVLKVQPFDRIGTPLEIVKLFGA